MILRGVIMKMKSKYERMSREEKKEVYKKYKSEKLEFVKKMERMFLLCRIGIVYSVLVFLYDFFLNKNVISYSCDIIIFVFCLIVLIKINNTKKNILNNYVIGKKNKRS